MLQPHEQIKGKDNYSVPTYVTTEELENMSKHIW
jgi:hypothetical protein